MDATGIAWLSSAFALAYLACAFEPFELPECPEEPLIPIKANGRDIYVPPAFVDVIFDISKFSTKFEFALKKAVPELESSSGTLWTIRIVRDEKPELEKALRAVDDLRRDHSALIDKAINAYDSGTKIEEDLNLRSHRKQQREKMHEIQELMKDYWPDGSSWILL